MVQLARAVKDAQMDEKCCYHCSSPEHFIRNCPLMKTARDKKQLNGKEGMAMVKGAWTPLKSANVAKSPQQEAQKAIESSSQDSLLESRPFSMMVWHGERSQGKDKRGELYGSPGQWGAGEHYNHQGM